MESVSQADCPIWTERLFASGEAIYGAGAPGLAWRIVEGSVRLDRPMENSEASFANLAIDGDIIGAETLIFGQYTFSATALSPCRLVPWPEGEARPAGESLLHALAASEKRMAEVIALRCGQAAHRVGRLMHLLSGDKARMTLPTLRDMADMTALTAETVCRILNSFKREGILQLDGARRGPYTPKTAVFSGRVEGLPG